MSQANLRTALVAGLPMLAAVLLTAAVLHADDWAPPKPRVFASKWGDRGFKLLQPKFGGASLGLLFHLDAQGKEVVLWQKTLVNTPHQVFVADGHNRVVTIDTYGTLGHAHALVLYDDKGNVVKDYALEDLLTADEIKTKVKQTVSSRHWAASTTFAFENNHFVARLSWGRTLHVNLQTGKLGM